MEDFIIASVSSEMVFEKGRFLKPNPNFSWKIRLFMNENRL